MNSDGKVRSWRPSQWMNAGQFGLLIIAAAGIGRFLLSFPPTLPAWIGSTAQGLLVVTLLVGIWRYLQVRLTAYSLSDEQLNVTKGVVLRVTDHLELYRIKDVRVTEPLWLRPMKLGHVWLHTSDKTCPILPVLAVKHPGGIAQEVRERVELQREKKGVREFD